MSITTDLNAHTMHSIRSFLLILFALTVVSCNILFKEEQELQEGSDCTLENDSDVYAKCKKMTECADKLKRIAKGERHFPPSEHCGYTNFTEIVCCAPRVAEDACEQFADDDTFRTVVFEGTEAVRNEFPFMVALGYVNDDFDSATVPIKYRCGASLISNQHVLTAAHCVNNIQNLVPVVARLGNVDLTTVTNDTQEIGIESIVSHPQFRRSKNYHDIAILKLKTRVKRIEAVRPICLYTSNLLDSQPMKDTSYLVLGWGLTSFDNDGSPKLIKSPDLSFVDQRTCASSYVDFGKLPNGLDQNMICIRDLNDTRRADACHGDSGGPLIMKMSAGRPMFVGVTAFGRGCGTQHPAVYIGVFHYLEWIENVIWNNKVTLNTPLIGQKVSESAPVSEKVSQMTPISSSMHTWSGYYYRR